MDKLIKDRQLFPQLIHAIIGANIVVTLVQSGMTNWVILIGILAPFPVVYFLFSNKYYKQLKFKDEISNSFKGKIFGKNLLIYFTLLVTLIALISIVSILQEHFFTFDYQGIFILIVNIIYLGALFFLFLKKVDCR